MSENVMWLRLGGMWACMAARRDARAEGTAGCVRSSSRMHNTLKVLREGGVRHKNAQRHSHCERR